MTSLQCSVTDCGNNFYNFCCRPDIKVGGQSANASTETFCSSYIAKSLAPSNAVDYDNPNPECEISCDAMNCTFNASGACGAEKISVDSMGASYFGHSECSSFIKKD